MDTAIPTTEVASPTKPEAHIDVSRHIDGEERRVHLTIPYDPDVLAQAIKDIGKSLTTRSEAPVRSEACSNGDVAIKIAADGTHLPADYAGTDHVAVLFPAEGLMFAVESLGDPSDPTEGMSQEKCIERCKGIDLLGYTDWELVSRAELVAHIDDTRREPALDTNLFPRVKPHWHWTRTAVVGSSASAWYVDFYLGSVGNDLRYYHGFALAVRRVGQ